MQVEISKHALNHKLSDLINKSSGAAIVKAGLISAKWVEIRGSKVCRCCGNSIKTKTLALTASIRDTRGYKHRTYICYMCSDKELKNLKHMDEKINKSVEVEVSYLDYDDGSSSNGY